MFKRMSITLMLALLIGSLLAACGAPAPAPVTLSSLPVFAGATESADENLAAFLGGAVDTMNGVGKNVAGKAYAAPEGATWDAIKSFYTTELAKTGWKTGDGSADGQAFERGNQIFLVRFAEGAGYIVVLAETKS
jgi:hypothetical protein